VQRDIKECGKTASRRSICWRQIAFDWGNCRQRGDPFGLSNFGQVVEPKELSVRIGSEFNGIVSSGAVLGRRRALSGPQVILSSVVFEH
jgi:hypothetical protein